MRKPSPLRAWRLYILVVAIAVFGGLATADKPAMPRPAPTPAPAPAAKPAPRRAAKPARAKSPAPPAPQPQPAPAQQLQTITQAPTYQRPPQDPNLPRLRAEWFQSQRAYPFDHIPADAFQKALAQRDLLYKEQHSGKTFSAGGLVTFPGDGLWHPLGPQPTNNPFGMNGGFPTASGRVTAMAVDTTDNTGNTVYLGGAAGGVWKTTDGGAHWTALTDTQPSLAVGSIAIDPNNHLNIYVGTGEENFSVDAYYGAGILKSTDGGTTWTQLGASVFAGPFNAIVGGAKIGAIAVQPGNSNIVLAAVTFSDGGTSGGIYRSTDAGTTWNQVSGASAPVGAAGTAVVFDPAGSLTTTATVYAAMGDPFPSGNTANGIYKSTNSGVTWTKLAGGLPTTNLGRIQLGYAPSTTGATAQIYAAIADSSNSSFLLQGFFVTKDGGTNWTQLTNTPDFCKEGSGGGGQCYYDVAIGVHPTNPNFVVVGGAAYSDNSTTLFKSTDGGNTWSTDSSNNQSATDFTIGSTSVRPHVDTHVVVFTPLIATNSNLPRLYTGDDGGVWRTDDPTPANPLWVDLNATLGLSQFYPGAMSSVSDENYGFGGTQDNDIQTFSGTLDWNETGICGDGGGIAVDSNTPTTIYGACNLGSPFKVIKSVLYGMNLAGPTQSFKPAETAISVSGDRMQFIPPLTMDPENPSDLYFGTCRVWQTTNATATWTAISGDLTATNLLGTCGAGSQNISTLSVSANTSANVLVGTTNGKVWQTTTFGGLWSEIDNGLLPNRHVTAVRYKPTDSTGQIAYVTFSGFGSCVGCDGKGHVFKTINGGTSWADISGNLPDTPVNDIIVDHTPLPAFDALYIATDVGVFSCPDPESGTPCTNWTVIGDPLPNSPVLALSMRDSTRILHAYTHGRGAFFTQLRDEQLPPLPLLSSITPAAVMAYSPITNVTVQGANFSANTVALLSGLGSAQLVTTTVLSTTQLTMSIPSSLLTTGIVFSVTLSDPLGVEPQQGLPFTVMNPIPVITSIINVVPNTGIGVVGEPVTFTLGGTGFVSGTEMTFNGVVVASGGTASSGGTQLVITVPGTALTAAMIGSVTVSLSNPLPGGGPSTTSFTGFSIIANAGPEATFTPPGIAFSPGQNPGTTSLVKNTQLSNTGGATLNLSSTAIVGPNQSAFALVAPTAGSPPCNFSGGSVTVGNSCFFGMTFSPSALATPGPETATLQVSDNDSDPGDLSPQNVPITGNVNGPVPFLFPSPLNFGSVPKGTASMVGNELLGNTGTGLPSLNVASIGILVSANSPDFAIVAPTSGSPQCIATPFSLSSLSFCGFGVTFTPSIIGAETATLRVTFSNSAIASIDVPLSGTGVAPVITSISPAGVATGGPPFTLTVNGVDFVFGATVNFNGTALLSTFVSSTQLLASVPASDIAAAGSFGITATNPSGGGTSEPKTLVVAAAPTGTNDDFNNAIDTSAAPYRITEDTTLMTTNTGGRLDPTPACAPGGASLSGKAKSAWFKFVATATGKVEADTRFSGYATILSVWTGAPGSFIAVTNGCASGNVAGSPAESLVGFNVTSGTTYFLMVTDVAGVGGTLTFSLDFASAAPANDDWANATTATAPYTNTVNTILATINTGTHADPTPACAPGGAASGGISNSVWYKFVAGSSGTVTADTLTSPYDTILSVWTGTPGSFVAVASGCNDNAAAGIAQSQVTFSVTPGQTYYLMITAVLGDGGTTNFHLNFSAALANPVPTITTLSPSSATAGAAAQTLTINGTNFLSTSTVTYNAVGHAATFVSATQLTIQLSAGDQATAGTFPVVVTNPAPGGGASNAVNFTVNNPVPTITTLSPSSVTAGAAAQTLTINGTNFLSTSTVTYNAVGHAATFVSATQLTIQLSAGDQATAGAFPVVVTNPAPGGGASNAVNFTVNNPVPTIATLSPSSVTAGAAAQTLTINGTSFLSTSTVTYNAVGHAATFVSATQLTIQLSAGDQATAGAFPVVVTNPAPGGGPSNAVNFTVNSVVNNPVPTITTLSPSSVTAGAATQTLTINGTNFLSTSTVTYNAAGHAATFVSATQLTIQLSAGDQATAGTFPVVVTNPAPGGGPSNAVNFTVNNPVPTITTLSPSSVTAGAAAQTLTINGTNFLSASTVTYNAVGHAATFVSATQLTIQLSAGDQATAGTFPVVVTNPAPGGGASNAVNFTVNNPVPTITTLLPSSVTAGAAAQTLTINGTNFLSTSTVTYNAVGHAATFVSATQLTIQLSAGDQATAGAFPVVVTNPAPGGGASNAVNFTVNNPVPTITTLSPSSVTAGAAAQTLTINGTNFLSASTVTYNAVGHAATFVSATQLTIQLSAGDQATGGIFPVVVTNPAPGGGASNAVNFTVNNPVPTITTLSPSSVTAGAAAQTLTINGTNFLSTSTVTYNAVGHASTFVSATQLTIQLSAGDQATAGAFPVVVTNPAPGGGASNAVNFTVNNPVPTITTLSPSSVTAGAAAQTLTINGTNVLSTSTVTYNAVGHAATFVSATQLTIQLSAGDQATAGAFPVVVTNPAPGGGPSNAVNFTVNSVVNNPVPTITTLSPSSVTAGAAAQTLTINGTNFISTSTVTYNAAGHAATFVSATQLTIQLSAGDQATGGIFPVVVTNPAPGGGPSNAVNFTVNNLGPTITSLSPSSASAGAAAQTLTINGTNFVSNSTVTYNAVGHAATFVSATQLTIQLSAGDQATGGIFPVVVTNPAPGGGPSTAVNFTVNNPVPTIASLSPSSASAGAAAQTLTINGTNFVSTSTVTYNAVGHAATFVSATQLTIQLSVGDQATVGIFPVMVTNPAPGGGASTAINFTVNNPVPTITSLSPSSASVGAAAQTLTINGSNFLSTSTVTYNSVGHATTFVSATQLTIQLSAGDQATGGIFPVVVTNPAPGGGPSTAVNFTVNNLVPTITSLSPSSASAGAAAQTLTINGTNFVSNSTVTYNAVGHAATFVSATQLTIQLSAGDQATGGIFPVVVTNPAPGGGPSTAVNFTVNNLVPTITSLSPSSASAGAAAQTLTINGTNFVSNSTVTYNAVGHAATFVSATQLTIQLSAGDQATAGIFPVVVTNPAPGGGPSTAVNFTVNNPVPTIASLSPSSASAGAAAQTLTINGTNFVSTSTVTYNAVGHAATFVSATQLTIQLSVGDQATVGIFPVMVTNPAPGGGASTAINFTVNNPVPTITSLSPSSASVGAAAQTLTINGSNFLSTSTVTYNSVGHATTFVSATQLTIQLSAGDQATGGIFPVVVTNPAPGGGPSTAVNFTVNNLVPTITSLSPSSASAGAAAQTLTINGTNFVSNSTVTYNAVGHAATFVSATQLTIQLSAGDQATGGIFPVVVTNPAPGGGPSTAVNFTVNNLVPTITSLSPSSASAGAAAQTLTINGTNFVSNSTVTYNAVGHAATFVSATQLTIQLSAGDQATGGIFPVVVTNPAPGGGPSTAVNFTVNNPVPTIASLSPSSASAGAAAQTLTINGTNFVSTSTVTYNAVGHAATFVSATQLTIQLSVGDQATVGIFPVMVTNPAPGGGASTAINFTVNNPVPTITSLSPSSASVGAAAQTLTINGSNFLSTSTVTYNSVGHATTFVSATQLTIQLSAGDQATGGIFPVVVTNPAPGGGPSTAVNFTVNNLVPTITSLSPSSASAGAAAQTLTINGTNFVSNSTVTYNAVGHAATFVSATQLTIQLSAGDQATGGIFPVVVTNPAPGGGPSTAVNFTVNNLVPTITSLSPSSASAGAAAQTLTINGTNFVSNSTVTYNAVGHAATFVSATQLTIQLSAGDQATGGIFPVVVTNPAPGGGPSTAVNFTVNNPVPTIASLSPSSASAGAAAQTLTINGTNFVSTSTVTYNAVGHAATFVSATQLTIQLSVGDQATVGIFPVMVTNPAPGGGASTAINFTVNNPVPTITSLSPSSASVGAAAQTLTINGSNFLSTSTVTYNSVGHATTFVSATQLTIQLSAGDQATGGIFPVVVTNPAPGGGPSTAVNFTVNNLVPTITSLSPSSASAGAAAQTLTINGTNFVSNSTVTYNAVGHAATFVSATQLTIQLSAGDQTTAGVFPVVVTNPAPGGGVSSATNFTVNNPAPGITSLSPTNAPAGAGFTLTVNGTSFVQSSVIKFNGAAQTTTFVNAGQLTATITAAEMAAGNAVPVNVNVTTPPPGGGTTANNPPITTFTINDYALTGPGAPVVVPAGQTATFNINITPTANGFSNAVQFTVSGLPAGAAGSFTPPSLTPGGVATATALKVTTTARNGSGTGGRPSLPGPGIPAAMLWLLALITLCIAPFTLRVPVFARSRFARVGVVVALLLVSGYLAGCATGGFPQGLQGTPAGNYPLTVTATSGTAQRTTIVTLTVQ